MVNEEIRVQGCDKGKSHDHSDKITARDNSHDTATTREMQPRSYEWLNGGAVRDRATTKRMTAPQGHNRE